MEDDGITGCTYKQQGFRTTSKSKPAKLHCSNPYPLVNRAVFVSCFACRCERMGSSCMTLCSEYNAFLAVVSQACR